MKYLSTFEELKDHTMKKIIKQNPLPGNLKGVIPSYPKLIKENKVMSKRKITGEDVAALLHGIHTHAEIIAQDTKYSKKQYRDKKINYQEHEKDLGKLYYSEEDLLPILKALGLPAPKWKYSIRLKEWKKHGLNKQKKW